MTFIEMGYVTRPRFRKLFPHRRFEESHLNVKISFLVIITQAIIVTVDTNGTLKLFCKYLISMNFFRFQSVATI